MSGVVCAMRRSPISLSYRQREALFVSGRVVDAQFAQLAVKR